MNYIIILHSHLSYTFLIFHQRRVLSPNHSN